MNRYFSRSHDIQVLVYNLLAIVGIVTGIAVAALAMVLKENVAIVIIDLSIAVLSYALLRVAEKRKNYHLCSWIFVAADFFVFFPLLYFSCGGHLSGAAYCFTVAFVFTAMLLDKYERVVALVVEFVLYVCCLLAAYYRPEMVFALPTEFDYLFSTIFNLTTTAAILLTAILVRTRIFNKRQEQIEELNRELATRNETLAEYDTMKSDFLATVAHEINTPLAVISAGSSDTLDLLKETPLNTDEIIDNQILISQRARMIGGILLDLMDTVAIERGRLSLSRQPMSLIELLKNVCAAQHKKIDLNNNRVACDLQAGLPQIWLDPVRIEQVMINLLSNAFRHTREGTVSIKLSGADKKQIVCVTDDGEGMDEEMKRVILKYYVSTKADYWRHGIGLYICRQIIAAHGGEIWIESEKGSGTAISFALPEENKSE